MALDEVCPKYRTIQANRTKEFLSLGMVPENSNVDFRAYQTGDNIRPGYLILDRMRISPAIFYRLVSLKPGLERSGHIKVTVSGQAPGGYGRVQGKAAVHE